jgi:hypothetical protein
VVDERAARRLDDAPPRARAGPTRPARRPAARVGEQRPITSAACKSSIIRAQWNASGAWMSAPPRAGQELLARGLGQRRADRVAVLDARQRADLVPAVVGPRAAMNGNFM